MALHLWYCRTTARCRQRTNTLLWAQTTILARVHGVWGGGGGKWGRGGGVKKKGSISKTGGHLLGNGGRACHSPVSGYGPLMFGSRCGARIVGAGGGGGAGVRQVVAVRDSQRLAGGCQWVKCLPFPS